MKNLPKIFSQTTLGPYSLKNKVVMSGLTRCRCGFDSVPLDRHAEYYSLRAADAGMCITECTVIAPEGNSYPCSAGIFNDAQVAAWKKVVKACHDKKGLIYAQIWHGGRSVHPDHVDGLVPVAPSPIPITDVKAFTKNGPQSHVVPREITKNEIHNIIKQFKDAAIKAKEAGFDGLEAHGANGYLIDQFLRDGSNQRTDEYGGSLKNRARFCLEVMDELIDVFGADKVGIKLSPALSYQSMKDSDPNALMKYLISEFNSRNVSFLELMEGLDPAPVRDVRLMKNPFCKTFKKDFKGKWIANFGFNQESASDFIEQGYADLVSFGESYVCNSNLVEKFKTGQPLNHTGNVKDKSQIGVYFYGQTDVGYLDLSVYEAAKN